MIPELIISYYAGRTKLAILVNQTNFKRGTDETPDFCYKMNSCMYEPWKTKIEMEMLAKPIGNFIHKLNPIAKVHFLKTVKQFLHILIYILSS